MKRFSVFLFIFMVSACNLPEAMQTMPQFNSEMRMRALAPGQVIGSDIGVELGALTNSIDASISVAIESISNVQADQPLDSDLQQVGEYFMLFPEERVDVSANAPLILAIEIPDGVSTDSLALATLIPADEGFVGYTNRPGPPAPEVSYWALSPGQYDAPGNRFFVTIISIPEEGRTMTLVSNSPYSSPSMEAPISNPISQSLASPLRFDITPLINRPLQDETVEVVVLCVGFDLDSTRCQRFVDEIPNDFLEAYNFYVNQSGFRQPNLQRVADIDVSQWPQAASASMGAYVIRIEKAEEVDESPSRCKYTFFDANGELQALIERNRRGPLGGYLALEDNSMTICIFETGSPDGFEAGPYFVDETITRHELFHAIQFAYNHVGFDFDYIEGSAEVASESLFMVSRDRERPFRLISVGMFRGSSPAALGRASYETQDFFVFLANKFNLALSQLMLPFLETGLDKFALDTALKSGSIYPPGYSLSEAYWDWAKNHAIEHTVSYGFGDSSSGCRLTLNRVNNYETAGEDEFTPKIIYDDPRRTDPVVRHSDMFPLVSQVAWMQFEPINTGTYIASILVETDSDAVRSKIYDALHPTGFCGDLEESREATFAVGPAGTELFYALFSNTALDSNVSVNLIARSYMVEIVSPAVSQNYVEGNQINLQAQTFVSGFSEAETDFPVTWHLGSLESTIVAEGLNASLVLQPGEYVIHAKFGDAFAMSSFKVLSSGNSGELVIPTGTPIPDPQQIITPVTEPLEIATLAPTSTEVAPVTIVGTVLRDENGNGVQDAEDTYVSGIPIYLTVGNVCAIPGNAGQTSTDGSGLFSFNGLAPGNYCVAIDPDDFPSIGGAWVPANGDRIQVSPDGGDLEIVNFFVQPIIN